MSRGAWCSPHQVTIIENAALFLPSIEILETVASSYKPNSLFDLFQFQLMMIFVKVPTPSAVATLSNVALSTRDIFAGPFEGNPFPTFAFFGFSSDLPIASLSMAPHAIVEPILDNFMYAKAADPLPEPSSLLLLSSGLVSLVANAWRNRRR